MAYIRPIFQLSFLLLTSYVYIIAKIWGLYDASQALYKHIIEYGTTQNNSLAEKSEYIIALLISCLFLSS